MNLSKIPQELKARPQWVLWKSEIRDGKPTKIPYCPQDQKRKAEADNPATWGTHEKATAISKTNGFAGIGYEFSPDDPYTGVDLDKCRDPETGSIEPWARTIIDRLASYTEISPSGRGVHILIKGKLPPGGNRKSRLEMYDSGRYFTVTGQHLEGTPLSIEARQTEIEVLHNEIFAKPQDSPKTVGPALGLSDRELIEKAKTARNGDKFSRLWAGDTTEHNSPSEATAALLNHIIFWCGQDFGRIDRLFRQSGLMRDKWDRPQSGSTWGALEVHKVIARATEFYQPPQSVPNNGNEKPKPEAPKPPQTEKTKPASPAIQFVTGRELQSIEFKDPSWVVPGILPEGLCLLSARPKKGKTWLALDVSVAKSSGGCALGKAELRITPGKVLYLCLEDKLRRAKKRLEIILGNAPFPEDLILAESWPRLDKGGLEALQDFLKEHSDCKLLVVDSFAKIKPPRPKNIDPYDFDMSVGGILQTLAQERQICLLLIYHNRKSEGEDPLDDVIGSTGLTGAVDAVLILRRGRGQADGTLFVSGRDVEERALALKFHPGEGLWELLGDASEVAKSQQRQEIIELIKHSGPQTVKEVAKFMSKPYETIRKMMQRMTWDGELKSRDGKYYRERE